MANSQHVATAEVSKGSVSNNGIDSNSDEGSNGSESSLLAGVTEIFSALPIFTSIEPEQDSKATAGDSLSTTPNIENLTADGSVGGARNGKSLEEEVEQDSEDGQINLSDYYSYSISNRAQDLVENGPMLPGRRDRSSTNGFCKQ
jgi:hypothetical protein